MATNNARGFVASRHLDGGMIRTRRYRCDGSSNTTPIMIGDPVVLVPANGTLARLTAATAGGPKPVLGVVRNLYDSNGKPLTFSQPTRGPYLQASTIGYADVYDEPKVTYIVQCDGSATEADIGVNVDVTAGVGNTAAGLSTYGVILATATTTWPFKVIGVSPFEETIGATGANLDVEVIVNTHVFNTTTGY